MVHLLVVCEIEHSHAREYAKFLPSKVSLIFTSIQKGSLNLFYLHNKNMKIS